MKKNLLSVLILVLLIVNIAMTAVMMISVTGTNGKTAELVTNIASVLNLELYNPGGIPVADVPLTDTETYDMTEMTIPLRFSDVVNADGTVAKDTKQKYIMFTPSLYQNTKHEDYKAYGGETNMTARASLIQDAITNVVRSHTLEECQDDLDGIRDEILTAIQKLYDSNFIFKVGLNGIKYG